MHRSQFAVIGFGNVNVERLALIDERAAIGCHFDDDSLRNFPHRLVQGFQIVRNSIDVLVGEDCLRGGEEREIQF